MRRNQPLANLCQICARVLLIWTFWRIWCDERTVSYEQSTAVGVPIPSLATFESVSYTQPKTQFCSILFQFQNHRLAEICLSSAGTGRNRPLNVTWMQPQGQTFEGQYVRLSNRRKQRPLAKLDPKHYTSGLKALSRSATLRSCRLLPGCHVVSPCF